MKLSRYKIKKHDQEIDKKLKLLENRAALGLFAIPLVLGAIGGKELAKLILIIWPIYIFIYIRMFRKLSAQFLEKGRSEMSKWGNGYYFYQVCWALLVILLPLAFACFMDFLEDMTPNQ